MLILKSANVLDVVIFSDDGGETTSPSTFTQRTHAHTHRPPSGRVCQARLPVPLHGALTHSGAPAGMTWDMSRTRLPHNGEAQLAELAGNGAALCVSAAHLG